MRFAVLKEFRPFKVTEKERLEEVVSYLTTDLLRSLKDLTVGLTKLSFADNFESFEVEITIPATTEVAIRNELISRLIPTKRLIVRGGSGSQDIVDGDTAWDNEFVYLKNDGGSTATATVVFLR